MSSKEMEFDGNDVLPTEDHDLRISMKNPRLRLIVKGRNISQELIKFL